MNKPRIIVLSGPNDDDFNWLSDGWNDATRRGTPKAQALMAKAHEAIEKANNVTEAIALLEEAGFEVVKANEPDDEPPAPPPAEENEK